MYTLGYNFKPWTEGKAIADGPSILNYIRETASEAGIDRNIRYQHTVTSAKWSSEDAAWTIEAHDTASDETVTIRCGFLLMCSGYYNYEQGYLPEFKGATTSGARSSIRNTGPRTSTTAARKSSSSARARPR